MALGVTVGCFLLIYAPYIISFFTIWRRAPQLVLIVLSGSCAGILSLIIITVLFEGLKAVCNLASWTPALAAAVVGTQVVVQFLLKIAVLSGWVLMQKKLRKENQALVSCTCRFAPVSGAVGLGFAMTSTWATGGVLFDAYRQLPHFSPYAAAYDLDVCPQLPLLVHGSLQCAMLTLGHVSWGIMAGQPAVALVQYGVRSYFARLHRRWRPFYTPMREVNLVDITFEVSDGDRQAEKAEETRGEGKPNSDSEGPIGDAVEKNTRTTSPPEALAADRPTLMREEVEGALRDCERSQERVLRAGIREDAGGDSLGVGLKEAEASPRASASVDATTTNIFESPLYRYNGVIPKDTIFLSHLDFAFLSMVSAFILQLVFSMISIVHSGALDVDTGVEVTTRGCVVSLPIQLVVLMVSVVWALWTLREESLNID